MPGCKAYEFMRNEAYFSVRRVQHTAADGCFGAACKTYSRPFQQYVHTLSRGIPMALIMCSSFW